MLPIMTWLWPRQNELQIDCNERSDWDRPVCVFVRLMREMVEMAIATIHCTERCELTPLSNIQHPTSSFQLPASSQRPLPTGNEMSGGGSQKPSTGRSLDGLTDWRPDYLLPPSSVRDYLGWRSRNEWHKCEHIYISIGLARSGCS